MFTLDSDILAILLAIISFIIPAINAAREKKKKQKAREQVHTHTIVEESSDEPRRNEMEELFSELLGLQHKEEQQEQEKPVEEFPEQEQNPVQPLFTEDPKMQETAVGEPCQEGIQATVNNKQQESEPAQEENAKSLKERIKANPKDMVLFAEILKPKFKEFEN